MQITRPVTKYSKILLEELKHGSRFIDVTTCQDCINKDPNAGLLTDELGNNAYHLLLGSDYSRDIVMILLPLLLSRCPIGIQRVNRKNNLPLHLCLSQPVIIKEAAYLLLSAYPQACSMKNSDEEGGWYPLFLTVMRDNSDFELSKTICKLCPDSVKQLNASGSLPIHFAVNRENPNIDILRMLVRRHREGCSVRNNHGLLPMHCLLMSSTNTEAFNILYDAYEEALSIPDRQGKTSLHLAVLTIGKNHFKATKELEEELSNLKIDEDVDKPKEDVASDSDDEDDTSEGTRCLQENNQSLSRDVIREIIKKLPSLLVTQNNFFVTPVETLLEKLKPTTTKKKQVKVYGLYDDPLSARILLISHQRYARFGIMSSPRPRHLGILKELNWESRKYAILASYGNVKIPISKKKQKSPAVNSVEMKDVMKKGNVWAKLRYAAHDCLMIAVLYI
jgi:ankyrin repeat protein